MPEQKMSPMRKIISSKPLSYLLILLLIFALVSLGREVSRRLTSKKELLSLESQIVNLEEENQNLTDEIEKMRTEYFKEKAARLNFGLQKPGEQIIIIGSEDDNFQEIEARNENSARKIPNFKIWWHYFFR